MEEIVSQHSYQPERFNSSDGMFVNMIGMSIGGQFIECLVFDIPPSVANPDEYLCRNPLFGQRDNPQPLCDTILFFAGPLSGSSVLEISSTILCFQADRGDVTSFPHAVTAGDSEMTQESRNLSLVLLFQILQPCLPPHGTHFRWF